MSVHTSHSIHLNRFPHIHIPEIKERVNSVKKYTKYVNWLFLLLPCHSFLGIAETDKLF